MFMTNPIHRIAKFIKEIPLLESIELGLPYSQLELAFHSSRPYSLNYELRAIGMLLEIPIPYFPAGGRGLGETGNLPELTYLAGHI